MITRILAFVLSVCALVAQTTAQYPGSVATDAQLKVARNQIRISLRSRAYPGDTIITVSDPSRIVVNQILTVDREAISVTSISGNNLTVVRGFDGTTAAEHLAGAILEDRPIAWHHNALAAELKAIEQALGPNLANVPGAQADLASWSQTPGGTLSPGTNAITIAPVPRGVNGSNARYYVRVSGGTGTAENCLVTGGTAVALAPTGILYATCANAHSGAFSVGTASNGIAEAIISAGVNGAVRIPCGTHNIYATIDIPAQGMTVNGQGNCTVIVPQIDGMTVFSADAVPGFLLANIGNFQMVTAPAGIAGLNSVKGISLIAAVYSRIHDVSCDNVFQCVYLDRGANIATDHINLKNNSTIWAGSTLDGANLLLDSTFSDIYQYASETLALGTSHYYITLSRCITCSITRFKTTSLQWRTNGILLANDDEGDTISDVTLAIPVNGIDIKKTTVGSTTLGPSFNKFTNLDIDRWADTAITIDDKCYFNTISGSNFTGASDTPPTVSAIHFLASPTDGITGGTVTGNTFQNLYAGNAIWVGANHRWLTITGNYFDGMAGVVGVVVSAGTSDYLNITGNTFNISAFRSTSFVPLLIEATMTHSQIANNVGVE